MHPLLERLTKPWFVRSFLAGGVATAFDVAVVTCSIELLGLPRVPSVSAGVCVGGLIGFVLNKYFAFKDPSKQVGLQGVKYAVVFGGELALHAGLVSALVLALGAHYLIAKFTADFVVFNGIHMAMMRYVIFPKPKPKPTE
jgi:putative flippase GtrA